MPIRLNITDISIPSDVPVKLGKQKALKKLMDSLNDSWETKIVDDIKTLVSKFESFTAVEQNEIFSTIESFFDSVILLPESEPKRIFSKYLRIINLVLTQRNSNIYTELKSKITLLTTRIIQTLGCVPTLNNKMPLPPKEDLPPKFEETISNWKKIIWKNPSRNSSERIGFISVSETNTDDDATVKMSAARKFLLRQDAYRDITPSNNTSTATQEAPSEALSFADADFFAFGDLQADHLQPSEQIIARQQELVLAMNLDPAFGKAIYNSTDNNSYFIHDPSTDKSTDKYSGTKYFFMVYHNCIDNLWLISTSENTGQGKGNIDPVLWLRSHTLFGEQLFEAIENEGGLNVDTVLYTVGPRKIILANYVKEWFRLKYKELIATSGYTEFHIKQPFRERITLLTNQTIFAATSSAFASTAQVSSRQLKKEKVQVMSELTVSKVLAQKRTSAPPPDDSPDHHSSSVDSEKAEINDDNLSGMLSYVDIEKTSQLTKEVVEKYSKDNKKRKKDDASNTNILPGPNK